MEEILKLKIENDKMFNDMKERNEEFDKMFRIW